jgi:hypothetical protein
MCLIHSIGGAFTKQPEDLNSGLSVKAADLYDYNPLLFDFALKRTLRLPGTSKRFPASVFMTNPALGA